MTSRYLSLLITASLIIPIGSAVAFPRQDLAQMPPMPPSLNGAPPANMPEPPWASAINLSAEQKTKIQALHEQFKTETQGLHSSLLEADNQMRSLLDSDASPEQLRQQHQKLEKLHQQLEDQHFEMMLAERQVLTAEQRAQLSKWMQQNRPQPMQQPKT